MGKKRLIKIDESLVNESTEGSFELPGVSGKGQAEIVIGRTTFEAQVDPENLSATAAAALETFHAAASGEVNTPAGDATGSAHVDGPSAEAEAEASPDGLGGSVGVSAGSAGAEFGTDFGGEDVRGGVEFNAGLVASFEIGPTTEIGLPGVTVKAPNPAVFAPVWTAKAIENLVTDPEQTLENAKDDALNTLDDITLGVFDLAPEEDPDPHAVTNDDWSNSGPKGSGGQPFD